MTKKTTKVEWDGHGGQQEVQHVGIAGGVATAGTFRLSFDGATTTVIPFDASGDALARALNALSTIGAVRCERTDAASARGAGWLITFLDNVGDMPLVEATGVMLRGPGASPAAYSSGESES